MPEYLEYAELTDPTMIALPQAAVRAKWLAIDIEINARDTEVGSADFGQLLPKLWSGYWYLLKNNSVVTHGTLQWERQRIYEYEYTRIHDAMQRQGLENGGYLIDVDGVANPFDEPSGIYGRGLYKGVSSLGELTRCNSLPAHKIGTIVVYVPIGVVYTIKIQYESWCPLLTDTDDDGNFELTDTAGDVIPEQPNEPFNQNNLLRATFDEIARLKGYILPEDIPTLCANAGYTDVGNTQTYCQSQGYYPIGTNRYLKVTAKVKEWDCTQKTSTYYYLLQNGETSFSLVQWNNGTISCGQYHLGNYIRSNLSRNIDAFFHADVPNSIVWEVITATSPPTNTSVAGW